MKKLAEFDHWLFVKINRDCANAFFDLIMPWLRKPLLWVPLYIFLLVFAVVRFKKKAISWVLTAAITTGLTDFISSHVIKPGVGRLRPCNNAEMIPQLRMLADYCGQNGSFTSSHAANHFAMAVFFFFTLKPYWGNWTFLFFLWAGIICFAQVYVGVHFPADVFGGAVFGSLTGLLSSTLYLKYSRPPACTGCL